MSVFNDYKWSGAEELRPQPRATIPKEMKSLMASALSSFLASSAGVADMPIKSNYIDKLL